MRKVAFFMLLTSALYIAVGDLIIELLFEGGLFSVADTKMLWFVVAAYGLALPATGVSRMLQNTCYALGNTRSPARIAAIRVAVAAATGAVLMFPLDRVIIDITGELRDINEAFRLSWALPDTEREIGGVVRLGAVGIAIGSVISAWTEIVLLTRLLKHKLGRLQVGATLLAPLKASSATCIAAFVAKKLTESLPVLVSTPLVLGVSVCLYAVISHISGVEESRLLLDPARKTLNKLIPRKR